jgi:hypothetical protein
MLHLIASYPKSGNTYCRIFMARYLRRENDLNNIGFPLYSSEFFFPNGMPNDRRLCGPVCRWDFNLAKTHETGNLFFPNCCEKAVYIVRNPLDVAPSWAAHMMTTLDDAIEKMADERTTLRSAPHAFSQSIGSWSTNVSSWLFHDCIKVHAFRYETLVINPRKGFKQMLDFLEIPFVQERFDDAIEFSGFDKLKKLEFEKGFRESRSARGFFRSGKTGTWTSELTVDQARCVMADHAPMMRKLGYL